MPSRLGVGAVVLFWLGTTGYVLYREVVPRFLSAGPPPLRIDLADEATQATPTRWKVFRGDQHVGDLSTRMDHIDADDSFRFVNAYTNLKLDSGFPGVAVESPGLTTVVRVTRAGDLREQEMSGTLVAKFAGAEVARAQAEVTGEVRDGVLAGRCVVKSDFVSVDRPLEPVPVPAGRALNPMMPVSRLRDVVPGRRWVIREVDPLRDALDVLFREVLKQQAAGKSNLAAAALPPRGDRELVAEVGSAPERLDRTNRPPADCWVIEYRGDEVRARTWVAVADGRVLRQEAAGFGERLRFERED